MGIEKTFKSLSFVMFSVYLLVSRSLRRRKGGREEDSYIEDRTWAESRDELSQITKVTAHPRMGKEQAHKNRAVASSLLSTRGGVGGVGPGTVGSWLRKRRSRVPCATRCVLHPESPHHHSCAYFAPSPGSAAVEPSTVTQHPSGTCGDAVRAWRPHRISWFSRSSPKSNETRRQGRRSLQIPSVLGCNMCSVTHYV